MARGCKAAWPVPRLQRDLNRSSTIGADPSPIRNRNVQAGEVEGVLRAVGSGFRLPFEGVGLLRRNRGLWALSAAPIALTGIALALAAGVLYDNAGILHDWLTSWMPPLEVGAWYQWLWLGPAKAALSVLGVLLFLMASALAFVLAMLAANLVSSPLLDLLAQKVERIEAGAAYSSGEGVGAMLREATRSVWGELQRVAFFLGVWAVLAAIGLVPGGQLIAGPALLAFTIVFLPLNFSGYSLDRQQVTFRARRRWVRSELPRMAGFGAAAFAAGLVPGLNLLLIPALVAGGTLLALRKPPASDQARPS